MVELPEPLGDEPAIKAHIRWCSSTTKTHGKLLIGPEGFEPPTHWLKASASTAELRAQCKLFAHWFSHFNLLLVEPKKLEPLRPFLTRLEGHCDLCPFERAFGQNHVVLNILLRVIELLL